MYLTEEKKPRIFKWIVAVLAAIFLISAVFFAGMYFPGKNEVAKELAKKEAVYLGKVLGKYSQPEKWLLAQDVDFGLFWDVWDALEKEYVDKEKLNEKELFYGAVKGMVAAAGDPYTSFLDPKMTREFADDLAGTFEGIGAEIGIRSEILTIIAPLPDTPAERAGLRAGDKVYAIDGESTAGIAVDEAVRKIRGVKGTIVVLTISHDGMEKAKDISITRGTIIVKSVKSETIKDKNIFVLEITNFNEDTLDLFNKEVMKILENDPDGVILDLRNNPGGFLDTAVAVASEWIDSGTVVTEKFSDEEKNDFAASGRARLKDYKTVVLVNKGSASASEIVAGALQDYNKAVIIGEKTFGKGSVQTLEEFKDGSSLKVTVAKWLTPKGNNINEQGIAPDIEVEMKQEDYDADRDPQMEKAIEEINKK